MLLLSPVGLGEELYVNHDRLRVKTGPLTVTVAAVGTNELYPILISLYLAN